MDEYTLKTKSWLDRRFKTADESGIYQAHQPIYGFKNGHCDAGLLDRYVPTYRIMKALSHLRFDTLADVGAAEGLKAALAAKLFQADVVACDISEEACKRTREIFGIQSTVADTHNLPFKDAQFDIALCSETLEHVTGIRQAVGELFRVAAKAVVISVPVEPAEKVDRYLEAELPHAHIHSLNMDTFSFMSDSCRVIIETMIGLPVGLSRKVLQPDRS